MQSNLSLYQFEFYMRYCLVHQICDISKQTTEGLASEFYLQTKILKIFNYRFILKQMDIESDEQHKPQNQNKPSITHYQPSIKGRKSDQSIVSFGMGSILQQHSPTYPQKMSLQSNMSQKVRQKLNQQDLFENMVGQRDQYAFYQRGSFKLTNSRQRISDVKEQKPHQSNNFQKNSLEPQIKEQKRISCRCNKSKCLLMYCECFSKGIVCNQSCSCYQCRNNDEFEQKRQKAKNLVLQRDPNAFSSKLQIVGGDTNINMAYRRGCNCKKTNCFKKYCECFYAGVKCTYLCKCENCMNGGENAYQQ